MKRKFSEEQREELLKNKNVKAVTSCGVIYQDSFKQQAIELYKQGFLAVDIFQNAGFNLDVIGRENSVKLLSKWRNGIGIGLNTSTRNNNCNNTKIKSNSKYSDKEIKKILARNTYLEAENNFLKKLQALENQLK
jgi:transposase-like protein